MLGLLHYWLGKTKILKHAQFLCQFYELRKLNPHTGVEGCVFVAWFGQNTDITFLVSLFGCTTPAYIHICFYNFVVLTGMTFKFHVSPPSPVTPAFSIVKLSVVTSPSFLAWLCLQPPSSLTYSFPQHSSCICAFEYLCI